MTSLSLLPPIPRPPHDPLSLTLDGVRGWRAAALDDAAIDANEGILTLAASSGARRLDEPSGSFGGLVPPSLVAVGEGCDIWLIDPATNRVAKLDNCACQFIELPAIGGTGSGPRQFTAPCGIVAARGNLFVADTGNARVSIFSMRGYLLRGTLSVPMSEVSQPWTPVAIAADERGRVYVGDPNNGCVHRFSARGVWELAVRGLGAVLHIAVDCHGGLYVLTSASETVRVFDADGHEGDSVSSVAALRGRFAPLPFRVDVDGALDLSGSRGPCRGAFDAHGQALPNGAKPDAVVLETDGSFRTIALDSGIADCQWHRVLLCGVLPAGTSITVLTRTSEVAEPDDLVAALPDDAWDTWQTARRAARTDGACVRWDCLVRSTPGRFLWLRLRLRGDGKVAPQLERATIEFPRVSLSRWLPGVFGEDPASSEFTDRFLALFDTTLRSIERRLDDQAALFDPRSTPSTPGAKGAVDFLTWLASWVGIALDRRWPEARRRQYLREAPALFDKRGTVRGLRAMLLLYLGLDTRAAEPHLPALLLEHWRLRRWLFVGMGRLGEESMVWGKAIVNRSQLDAGARLDQTMLIGTQDPYRDPFHVYASTFTVFVPAGLAKDAAARKGLDNLLRDESPAHTRWHVELVEPRFRIGVQSMIGFDSVVGRYPPAAVTLDRSTLGRSTILGGPREGAPGPSMRVGTQARIGSTTVLD